MPIAQTVAADVSSVLTMNLDLARLLKLTEASALSEAQFEIYFLGVDWCRSHTHY
jgi:hypothetical protein